VLIRGTASGWCADSPSGRLACEPQAGAPPVPSGGPSRVENTAENAASWRVGERDRSPSCDASERRVVLVTCPPRTDPPAMRVPSGPGWALETVDETDTTHA
jgi:hypothetical protein